MSQEINLYEARLRPNRDVLTGRRLGGALLAVLLLVAVAGIAARTLADRSSAEFSRLQGEVTASQQTLATLGKTLTERKVSAALKAEIDGARAQLASRKAVMALLDSGQLGNSTGFSAVLTGFSRAASSDLWLTSFAVSAGGGEIEIRGRLLDASRLPAYVQRLGNEAAFKGRRFATLDMQRDDAAPASSDDGAGGLAGKAASSTPSRAIGFVLRSEYAGEAAATAGSRK